MALTRLHTFADGEIVTAANLNGEIDNIVTKINGGIGNAEMNTGDPLTLNKLALGSQILHITLLAAARAGGWPAATDMTFVSVPGLTASDPTNWFVQSVGWVCRDCGADIGTFSIDWGYFNAAGVWTTVTAILAATGIIGPGADDTGFQGYITAGYPLEVPFQAAQMCSFRLRGVAADAAAITVGDFCATVKLKRGIVA